MNKTNKSTANYSLKKYIFLFLCILILCATVPFHVSAKENIATGTPSSNENFLYEYGVFLSIDEEEVSRLEKYHTIVIDAEYFSKKAIKKLKKEGHIVYTYLNIGSLETFRKDYAQYSQYCIGDYENWEEEQWADVSQRKWQDRIKKLAQEYYKKGVDGFFIDNCDVYYFMGLELDGSTEQRVSSEDLFQGLCAILKDLRMQYKKPVIINGGDCFVSRCIKEKYKLKNYFTAVNQECVYTAIDFDKKKLKKAKAADTKYYESYLKQVKKKGIGIYLLEYSKSKTMIKTIHKKCNKKGYQYYVSRTIELK